MARSLRLSLAVLAALAPLAGCAVGPDYEPPRPTLPSAWTALGSQDAAQHSRVHALREDLGEWWRRFDDPLLASLVERALAQNLDLRQAAARVRQARGMRGVALGGLLPGGELGASHQYTRWSEAGQFPSDGDGFDLLQATFDALWEVDVFGGQRRRLEAAGAELEASVEALRGVRVTLQAEVAREYVELRGVQARLAIARQNLAAQRGTAALTRDRLEAGLATELDVARAEAQVATTRAALPSLLAHERQAIHRLAVLLGRQPGALAAELARPGPIPTAPRAIGVGVPADLLLRRPDLRRAERELAAATARIGVATAELYPRFFLLGSLGTVSVGLSDLFSAGSEAWSLGPQLRWSILDGGRILANIDFEEARAEEAALRFERALLEALREVEDALVAHAREQQRRAHLARAADAQHRAVELARERYGQGLVDFLAVLEAERSLYAVQEALARSDTQVATGAVALFKALGGGWRPGDEAPTAE